MIRIFLFFTFFIVGSVTSNAHEVVRILITDNTILYQNKKTSTERLLKALYQLQISEERRGEAPIYEIYLANGQQFDAAFKLRSELLPLSWKEIKIFIISFYRLPGSVDKTKLEINELRPQGWVSELRDETKKKWILDAVQIRGQATKIKNLPRP